MTRRASLALIVLLLTGAGVVTVAALSPAGSETPEPQAEIELPPLPEAMVEEGGEEVLQCSACDARNAARQRTRERLQEQAD